MSVPTPPVDEAPSAMGSRGFDDDVMELELDDELFESPPPKTPPGRPATMTRANPLASLGGPLPKIGGASKLPPLGSKGRLGGGLNPLAARPVSVSMISASSSSSSSSVPTEAALAARASASSSTSNQRPSGAVMGSMTGGDDDEGSAASSEPEIEYGSDGSDDDDGGFEPRIEERPPARDGDDDDDEVGTSNTAAAAAIDEDVIDVDFAFDDPTPQISSEDSAIDAIDAINRREKASRAKTQASLDKLTDKYRDKYELELSEEDREMMERVAGMTTAVDDDDDDDEFAYAFEGGERDETNVPVEKFVAKEMPRELVTNVRSMPMETFAEEDEEDLEETIEEEEEEVEEEAEEEEDDEDEVEVVMEDEDAEVASDALAAKLAPRDATSSATSAPPSTSAVDEWDQVNALREEEQHVRASDEAGTSEEDQFGTTKRFASISYVDAVRGIVEKIDVAALKPTLHVEDAPAGGCLACLFAPPRLDGDELKRDRDEMFATARTKLDDENEVHLAVLHTLYTRLMGTDRAMPRYGKHWEDVGFQGSDPATDLRGCGMLGLTQLLCLVTRSFTNAAAIHELSRDSTQEFPMAPLSINLTHTALKAVRRGLLNKEARRLGSVWAAADAFYCGSFYEFYLRWRDGGKTIMDSGHVKRELEDFLLTAKGTAHALALADNAKLGRAGESKPRKKASAELEFVDF